MSLLNPSLGKTEIKNTRALDFARATAKRGRFQRAATELGLTTANTHAGFSCLCVGPNDRKVIIFRQATSHSSTDGQAYIVAVGEDGTFAAPVLFFTAAAGRYVSDVSLSYDLATNRYFATVKDALVSDKRYATLRVFYTSGDPATNASAWTQATVTTPFTRNNCTTTPVIRRSLGELWLPCYGDMDGAAEDTANPAILRSVDNGANWTLLKKFDDVLANECAVYWEFDIARNSDTNFLICRGNAITRGLLIVADDPSWNTYEVRTLDFSVAGAPRVLSLGDHHVLFARNSANSGTGSMGYMAFSVDGYTWSKPEYTGVPYPCHQMPAIDSKGRVFLTATAEPSSSNTTAALLLLEMALPGYEEVLHKCLAQDIEIARRYVAVPAGGSYTTRWIYLPDRQPKALRLRLGSGSLSDISMQVQYWWRHDTTTFEGLPLEETVLSIEGGMGHATFTPKGKWVRFVFANQAASSRNLNAYLSL